MKCCEYDPWFSAKVNFTFFLKDATTFTMMTFNIMTVKIMGLIVTLSHLHWVSLWWVWHFRIVYAKCHHAECRYSECRGAIRGAFPFFSHKDLKMPHITHSKHSWLLTAAFHFFVKMIRVDGIFRLSFFRILIWEWNLF